MPACLYCGATTDEEDGFCRACGRALSEAASAPASAPASRPAQGAIPYRVILASIALVIASIAVVRLAIELHKVIFYLAIAVFIALVLNPVVARLQRIGVGRGKAISLTLAAVVIGGLAIGASVAAPLASRGVEFAAHAPQYLKQAEAGEGPIARTARRLHLESQLQKAGPGLSRTLSKLSGEIVKLGRRIASAAFEATLVVILAIFTLVEGPKIVDGVLAVTPPDRREAARRVGRSIARVVSGYTLGVLALAVLNGLVAAAALVVTRTPFVVPLAIWAGVVDIIPIVGGLLAIVPAGLFGFVHSVPAGIVVVLSILVYQQVKNHFLYPVVVGRAVQLNSMLVMVAVLVGAELGHVAGAILAIPVAGSLQVLAVEVARARIEARIEIADEAEAVAAGERARRRGMLDRVARRLAHRTTGEPRSPSG